MACRDNWIMKIEMIIVVFAIILSLAFASAAEVVSTNVPTVCCEKTQSGLFCQDVPAEQCNANSRQVPTSCESTSYCKGGFCFDSSEGTCLDNTPEIVCNAEGGVWSETEPPQCSLGCCALGDQAAFVTLTRCKKLSADLGLKTDFNPGINSESQCVLSVAGQQKGACVYEFEFEKTCRFTTRAECDLGRGNSTLSGNFYPGKLCSAEDLGTNCGLTTRTTLISGRDEVYFVDSCGNPANIYDASKVKDKEYWSNVKDKSESCNPNSANANSPSCGNCNYLLGSFGREATKETAKPTYGENICADLNCKKTSNGKSYKHGESWCVYNDKGESGEGKNAVGSRFFKHICINGDEVVEACEDFRQEDCVEDKITTPFGEFSQAACTVNRWQDCFVQDNKLDCENTDRRDCVWREGEFNVATLNETQEEGICVPNNPTGLKFWEGDDAKRVCSQGNAACIVTFEKGLFGGEECKDNCYCLSEEWERIHANLCAALGDCGPNINWIGDAGYKKGFEKLLTRPGR